MVTVQDLPYRRDNDNLEMEVVKSFIPNDSDDEDVSAYKFPKFATMYFQSNANGNYIRRPLRQPLLPLRNDGDQLVSTISFNTAAACTVLF